MKLRSFFGAAFLFALIACTPTGITADEDVTSVVFSIDSIKYDINDEQDTKVRINGSDIVWTLSDTLGIFPQTGAQVYFNTTVAGSPTTSFDGGGWGFKNGVNYYSYSPFIGDIYLDRNHIPVSFAYQEQNGVEDTDIGECCFMYTDPTSAEKGNLAFNYHRLGCILRVHATLPAGTYTDLAITAPSEAFLIEGWYNLMAASPVINPTRMSNQVYTKLKGITLDSPNQITVYMMVAPVDLKGTEITVSILNSEGAEYQQHKTPSGAYDAGAMATLTCDDLTAVPQSMGLIIEDWEDGGSISGNTQ